MTKRTRQVGRRIALSTLAIALLLGGCKVYEYETTALSEGGIVDATGLTFYRSSSTGTVVKSNPHGSGTRYVHGRRVTLIRYDFGSATARVIEELDGEDFVPANAGGWWEGDYVIHRHAPVIRNMGDAPPGCRRVQVTTGDDAFECGDEIGVVRIAPAGHAPVEASRRAFEGERRRVDPTRSVSMLRLDYVPGSGQLVMWDTGSWIPSQPKPGEIPYYFVGVASASAPLAYFHAPVPTQGPHGTQSIIAVGNVEGRLQYLVGGMGPPYEIHEQTGPETTTLVATVDCPKPANEINCGRLQAFLPERGEVYFGREEFQGPLHLLKVDYRTGKTTDIPVRGR